MTMTKYEEICAAFRETLPRRLALSSAIEELPSRLRNAVHAEMKPSAERAEFLSGMHGRHIPVVYLARLVRDENGKYSYVPCEPTDALFRDGDGILHFGLGLAIEVSGFRSYMLHWLIALEDISEDTFTLKIVGAPGTISMKQEDPESLATVARKISEWMLASQMDPSAPLVDKLPVGFRGA